MEPPMNTEYFLSGGAITFTLMFFGAWALTSFDSLSVSPVNIVVPPDKTILSKRFLLTSMSHDMIDLKVSSCKPGYSFPMKWGLNNNSGTLNL